MTALSRDPVAPYTSASGNSDNRQIVNTAVMYHDAGTALCTPTHGTTASRGRVKPWTGAAGEFLMGLWDQGKTTGDTSASPIVTGQVGIEDRIIGPVPVAGLAGSAFQADALKYVYLGDDNMPASLTLTRPAAPNNNPVGIVWQGYSATQAIILWFGVKTRLMLDMLGGVIDERNLGTIGAHGTALMGAWVAPYHGKILGCYLLCTTAPTDADVDITANIAIGGTPTTGGNMAILHGDAAGAKKSGTSITAANEFHSGDSITIVGTVNTAGTATDPGQYVCIAQIERQIGL